MILLCTGSRHLSDQQPVWDTMDEYHAAWPDALTVYVGDCPTGADEAVRLWCVRNLPRDRWRVFEADWRLYRNGAGPMRNDEMVHHRPRADRCLAWLEPGAANKGTRDCVDRARRADIPVTLFGGVDDEQEALPF